MNRPIISKNRAVIKSPNKENPELYGFIADFTIYLRKTNFISSQSIPTY